MQNKCILCGHHHTTGLNIAGCFLCFSCEQALLHPNAAQRLTMARRLHLLQLYTHTVAAPATK